jgi:uncharacterized YccA/Bax inhibitor family protein
MLTSGGAIVGFILALIVTFFRVKYLVPVYAAAEGLFLGGISAYLEAMYPGIVMQAVAGTFAALFSMLILYSIIIHFSSGRITKLPTQFPRFSIALVTTFWF